MAPRVSIGTPRMPADREIELDDRVRAREGGVDVAIALADERGLAVEPGRELAGRRGRIEQHRQRLDLDLHQLGRILGEIGVVGEHRGDRLADIAHAVRAPVPAGDRA